MGKQKKFIVAVLVVGVLVGLATHMFKLQATVQALKKENEQLIDENTSLSVDLEMAKKLS